MLVQTQLVERLLLLPFVKRATEAWETAHKPWRVLVKPLAALAGTFAAWFSKRLDRIYLDAGSAERWSEPQRKQAQGLTR
jgi:hypothetical protein